MLWLKNEVFRKGFDDWKPAFKLKCKDCNKEYQEKVDKCTCGSINFKEPDAEQYVKFDEFRTNCNVFNQGLEDIFRTVEDDVNICLVPGTKVLTRNGTNNFYYHNIEDVKIGMKVWTHTAKLKKVTEVYKRKVDEDLVVLYLGNKEIIKITSNHPVYTTEGWVRADMLTASHVLYKLTEVHPTWSKKLSEKLISNVDYAIRSVNIKKQQETRKYREEVLGVKYCGSKGHISPKRNMTYAEYYGIEKAAEIIGRQKKTKLDKGSNVGQGFHFRSKVGTFKGKNNPNWQEGISFILYGEDFSRELKRTIFERDSFSCQMCGRYPINCKCHHIDYNKKNNDGMNLITLCKNCHAKTNFDRDLWRSKLTEIINEKFVKVYNGTKILKVDKEHYTGIVYNLEVEEDHSYVGKGIIYHNCDDAYVHINKQYVFNNQKLYGKVAEVRRVHPALIEFDLDKNGLPKNSHWICLFHRDNISTSEAVCSECKTKMVPIMYVYNHRGRRIYLPEDELIHISKFSHSETYGYSPILTIMQKVLTLSGMDRFLYRYFFERKTPTQMILTSTDDPQSLEVERARIESRMMEDPTYTPWIAVSQRTGRGRTDVVKLWHTLQEMDYLPVRNEIRDRVSAIYGVPQIYMNVMEGIGGISGQTQQLKLFSNAVQSDQRMFNEKIFPVILKAFGITDWKLQLRPPEEKVEGQILTMAQQKVVIAAQMNQLGFDVELKPECDSFDTLDFTFSGKAQKMGTPFGGGALGVPGEQPILPGEEQRQNGGEEGIPRWERKQPNEEKVFDNTSVENEDSEDQENQVFDS